MPSINPMRFVIAILAVLATCFPAIGQEARDRSLPSAPLGLRADYYPAGALGALDIAVNAAPLATCVQLSLDASPPRGVSERCAVRWTGQIRIDDASDYILHVSGASNARLWIEGREIAAGDEKAIKFAAHDLADVRIDCEPAAGAKPQLTWSHAGQAAQIIPPASLYPFSKPIKITSPGTYVGSWQSDDQATAAVTIATTQNVIIDHSSLRGRGVLIATGSPGVKLVVKNSSAIGLDPGIPGKARGAFIDAYQAASLDIEHNFIEGVGGYGINVNGFHGGADQTVKILCNQIRNVDGRFSNGAGGSLTTGEPTPHAIILQHVHDVANVEIAFNEIIHDPYLSYVNDVINIYESSGTRKSPLRVHDNYIQGLYAIDPLRQYNSGCGIITDGASDLATCCAFVEIAHNQVVGTGNGGICIAAGHNITLRDNRILSCGRMPAGSAIFAQNIGSYIHAPKDATKQTFFANAAYNNEIGWVRPPHTFENKTDAASRGDTWFPEADPLLTRNNESWHGPITQASETGEYDLWQKKLSEEQTLVGAGIASAASTALKLNLSEFYNRIAIAHDARPFTGGIDGDGLGLSADLLHGSINLAGTVFIIGPAGEKDAVSANGQTIPVARKNGYAHFRFLALSASENPAPQLFQVQYADGSSNTFAQEMSDWHSPQGFAGESQARTYDHTVSYSGRPDRRACALYAYDFPLDVTRPIASLTLPKNPNVVIFAITLVP